MSNFFYSNFITVTVIFYLQHTVLYYVILLFFIIIKSEIDFLKVILYNVLKQNIAVRWEIITKINPDTSDMTKSLLVKHHHK